MTDFSQLNDLALSYCEVITVVTGIAADTSDVSLRTVRQACF